MKVETLSEVKICYSEPTTNMWLVKGYKIVRIFNAKRKLSDNGDAETSPCFVLGKVQESPTIND